MKVAQILVPIDFSAPSLAALEEATALARQFRARLTVLHSLEPIYFAAVGEPFTPQLDFGALLAEQRAAAKQHLARLGRALAKKRIAATVVLANGPAAEEIIGAARKRGADLIVMSTHGRSGLSHILLGSVAEKVVRGAPCPVLTVRGRGGGAARGGTRRRKARKAAPAKRRK